MSRRLLKAEMVGAAVTFGTLAFYFVAFAHPDLLPTILVIAITGAALWLSWQLVARFWMALIWIKIQKQRGACEWPNALVSVDKMLTVRPSQAEANVLRLVLLFRLNRDEELLREILGVVSRIHELGESPRMAFLESYTRLLGAAAHIRRHGPDAATPSQYWYDQEVLSNPAVPRFTRLVLPALDSAVLQTS